MAEDHGLLSVNTSSLDDAKAQILLTGERCQDQGVESPASELSTSQSGPAEQTDNFPGSRSPTPQRRKISSSECFVSSEDIAPYLDTPTASSLVTGSIESFQSEGLQVEGSPSPSQDAPALQIESCTHLTETTEGSSRHTHTHAWVQEQQQLSHTLSHQPDSLTDAKPMVQTNSNGDTEEREFDLLAKDFDQSLDQLNQLILDLDPEFEPNPTPARHQITRSVSLYTNGVSPSCTLSGVLCRQSSDVTYSLGFHSSEGESIYGFRHSPLLSPPFSQRGGLLHRDSADCGSLYSTGLDHVPPTPAFPVYPSTPYDSRSFLDMHTGVTHAHTHSHSHAHPHPHSHSSSALSDSHDDCSGDGSFSSSQESTISKLHSASVSSPLCQNHSTSPLRLWEEASDTSPFLDTANTHTLSLTHGLLHPHTHPYPKASLSAQAVSVEPGLLEVVEGLESLGLCVEVEAQPLLPQKKRGPNGGDLSLAPFLNGGSCSSSPDLLGTRQDSVKFVQDTTKFWYKPDITREQAIAALKDREPGSFIVRDSHSFRGAYGLAMKVATPPPSVLQQSRRAGDLSNELVRHFLIECTQKGVRLKGCPNEPYFGSLTSLVCQHSITPLALPCKLIIPDSDLLEGLCESVPETSTNSAAELLKQGAACNVWFLGSVELESLTGVQAVQKATSMTLAQSPPPTHTIVHFKVSAQGITLTDNQRKLFFRRHYPVNTVIFCALDPQERRWTKDGCTDAKVFGFVARKSSTSMENVCHLFAEHDPEQPASAIVNFVAKVMIGSHKSK